MSNDNLQWYIWSNREIQVLMQTLCIKLMKLQFITFSPGDNSSGTNARGTNRLREYILHDRPPHRFVHIPGFHGRVLGHWNFSFLRLRRVGLSEREEHRLATNEIRFLHHGAQPHFHPLHRLQYESGEDVRSSCLERLLEKSLDLLAGSALWRCRRVVNVSISVYLQQERAWTVWLEAQCDGREW